MSLRLTTIILGTLIRGINEFKKGQCSRINLVKDEEGYLLTDYHSVLNRWKNHFCQVVNVLGVKDVRQTEVRTAELLVHNHSTFEVEMDTAKLKGVGQIPAELIEAGDRTGHSAIHKLSNSI